MSRSSPLAGRIGRPGEPLALAERSFLGQIDLRGRLDDPAFATAVRAACGVEPPGRANTVARGGEVLLLWLGPDEWRVQSPPAQAPALFERLRAALAALHAAATDVGDGYLTLVLEDPLAEEVLARGCPLELHPLAFPVDTCAQSLFAKASVLLHRETVQRFAITVRRSFAGYLVDALQDAGAMARTA